MPASAADPASDRGAEALAADVLETAVSFRDVPDAASSEAV